MRKFVALFAALLFLISCVKKNIEVFPDESREKSYNDYNVENNKNDKDEVFTVESGEIYESGVKANIDSLAELIIITQIPLECINIVDKNDACEPKIRQTSVKSAAVLADCDKNSIQTAGELSDFAKNYPASLRGILGDLAGIADVANGTQKIISGIIPKSFKVIEFRFEMPIMDLSNILFNSLLRYNSLYEISQVESKIFMNRRENSLSACKMISVENIENNDPIIALGARKNLTALLFRKSDLGLIKLKLPNFNVAEFGELRVSAFINPSLDFETKNALIYALQNRSEFKKLDYDLSLIAGEDKNDFVNFGKDSIVIIYDKNDPIAYETAMISVKILKEKTTKRIVAVGDIGQKKLFYFNYDMAISVNPENSDFQYLSRKFFAKELTQDEMTDLKYKIDLFNVRIFLCSQQKISPQNSISRLEVLKDDNSWD